jgi:hypothetical protein
VQVYMRLVSILKGRVQGEVVGGSSPVVWSSVGGAVGLFEVAEYGVKLSKSNMRSVGVDS